MVRYYYHNNDYLNICRCYRAMYETKCIQEDPEKWKQVTTCHYLLRDHTVVSTRLLTVII